MSTVREDHAAAVKACREIIALATTEGRDLTADEAAAFDAAEAKASELGAAIKASEESQARFAAVKALGGYQEVATGGFLDVGGESLASALLTSASGAPHSVKSLVADTGSMGDAPLVTDAVLPQYGPARSLLAVLPVRRVSVAAYSYLRQNKRANSAAPVADGEVKPTSEFGLQRVESKLQVIAHLSEPVPEYYLGDHASLRTFVQDEMVAGLWAAVETQVVSGSGTAPNLRGILNTSGIQLQNFASGATAITQVRRAVTKLEVLGATPTAIVMNPVDFEDVDLMTTSNGQFLTSTAGAPLDETARRLWGVQVALSVAVPAGTALVLGEDAVELVTDGQVSASWGVVGDDFARNLVRARVEGRFDLAVTRPAGVVKVALAS